MSDKKRTGISSITIENFKGIGAPVTIPLKPITLLFGANSAGKSTVVEALLLMNDWLQQRGPDLDTLTLGGDLIHLGGFKRFVYKHDLSKKVRIRIEHSLGEETLPSFPQIFEQYYESTDDAREELESADVNRLVHIENCFVEVSTGWSGNRPTVLEYKAGINGEWVLSISNFSFDINQQHQVVKALCNVDILTKKLMNVLDCPTVGYTYSEPEAEDEDPSSIPRSWLKPLEVQFDSSCHCVEEDNQNRFLELGLAPDEIDDYEFRYMSHLVSQVGVGAGRLISEVLKEQIHIGPLRKVPRSEDAENWKKSSWSDGSQAWEELVSPKWYHVADIFSGRTDSNDEDVDPFSEKNIRPLLKAIDMMCYGPAEEDYGHLTRLVNCTFIGIVGLGYQLKCKNSRTIDMDGAVLSLLNRLFEQPRAKKVSSDLQKAMEEIRKRPVHRKIILVENETGIELRPNELGTGISQLIPVLVGLAVPSRVFSVEQPELHLHPAMQCDMGDGFILGRKLQLGRIILVETHSEHLILRLLRRIRETSAGEREKDDLLALTPDDVGVLYAEEAEGGVRIQELRIGENGQFVDEWPGGFFEEGFDEIVGGL